MRTYDQKRAALPSGWHLSATVADDTNEGDLLEITQKRPGEQWAKGLS